MWTVYLSGEIHTQWREEIQAAASKQGLPLNFVSPVTDHDASDAAGDVLGVPESDFWRDHQSARVNAMRTQNLIKRADFAVIRFGDKYKQWNAAFDAGLCAASDTPYITLHDASLTHPLKEVDGSAHATASSVEQVVAILSYLVKP